MSRDNDSTLSQITAEFERSTRIDPERVRTWMRTDDLEASGALMSLFTDSRHDSRIDPPLEAEEYYPFVRDYYMRAMLENQEGEWADPTTIAGHDFARWFQKLWDDIDIPRETLGDLKDALKRTYIAAEPAVRLNIVLSALEDLFKNADILDYFADWKNEQLLSDAYKDAKQLADAYKSTHERARTT